MIIYNDEDDYENGFNTARYRVQARVQKHNQTWLAYTTVWNPHNAHVAKASQILKRYKLLIGNNQTMQLKTMIGLSRRHDGSPGRGCRRLCECRPILDLQSWPHTSHRNSTVVVVVPSFLRLRFSCRARTLLASKSWTPFLHSDRHEVLSDNATQNYRHKTSTVYTLVRKRVNSTEHLQWRILQMTKATEVRLFQQSMKNTTCQGHQSDEYRSSIDGNQVPVIVHMCWATKCQNNMTRLYSRNSLSLTSRIPV